MATFPLPVVPTFLPGSQPQAVDFTTLWFNTTSFLQNKIVFRASQTTTATSLPSTGVATVIAYDNVLEDPYSGWNGTTHIWTPPSGYTGWFWVSATLRTVALQTNVSIGMQVNINNQVPFIPLGQEFVVIMGASATGAGCSGGELVYLVGGQSGASIAGIINNSTVNVNTSLTAGQQSTLEIVWLTL